LPFIDGVSLKDFASITVHEFDAYSDFRHYLRGFLLDVEGSLESDFAAAKLRRLSLSFEDGLREVSVMHKRALHRTALTVTTATAGTASLALVAIFGDSLVTAATFLGASGGLFLWSRPSTNHTKRVLKSVKISGTTSGY
jgi:hypothetical protein